MADVGDTRRRKTSGSKKGPASETVAEPTRRGALKLLRDDTVGVVALCGAGWWAASGVRAVAAQQDPIRVGQGMPAVVQIHDPQCALRTELRCQNWKALKDFGD